MVKDPHAAAYMAKQIAKCGFSVIGQDDENGVIPDYAYTVGLTDHGLPEIIVFGPPVAHLGQMLHALGHLMIEQNKSFADGDDFFDAIGERAAFKDAIVEDVARIAAGYLYDHYEGAAKQPRLMQMVLSDMNNLLPWEKGFDQDYVTDQSMLWKPGMAAVVPSALVPEGVVAVMGNPRHLH